MAKKLLSYITLSLFVTFTASATLLRVDNNPGSPAALTTAQAAHDSASAGDTLYFTGSGISYGNMTVTKLLYIFGPGYLLTQNPETQANPNDVYIQTISFNSGAEGSLITGVHIRDLYINTNNIFIKRNYIYNTSSYNPDRTIIIASNLSNIFLVQNAIYRYSQYSGTGYVDIYINSGGTNIVVKNNIIRHTYNTSASFYALYSGSQLDLGNNVIDGTIEVYGCTLYNNILRYGNFNGSSNTYSYNMGDNNQFGTANGNLNVSGLSGVFVGGSSSDGQFQLAGSSPAEGTGLNGEDMGAYGGIDPYVLSGLPSIPAIYFLTAPSSGSATEGLPVHIKIKSHN